jgi:hypothetical protein
MRTRRLCSPSHTTEQGWSFGILKKSEKMSAS